MIDEGFCIYCEMPRSAHRDQTWCLFIPSSEYEDARCLRCKRMLSQPPEYYRSLSLWNGKRFPVCSDCVSKETISGPTHRSKERA